MEQIAFDKTTRTDVETIRNALNSEINNPEYVKPLVIATLKDGAISIRAKSYLCAKIKLTRKLRYIEVRSKNLNLFKEYIDEHSAVITSVKEKASKDIGEWSRITIESLDDVLALSRPLSIVYMLVLSELGGESFGCCSRYVQCSDAKKCVNPNFMMSLACSYRRNLEAGRIFYGKNKNI